jgi:Tfp pilus assembly major pilin PilA
MPVITETLSQQMNHAFIMTNTSFAGQQVDTMDYRNAIVFYLKEIHGIRDESIKYKRINELLEIDQKKDQKSFIRNVACFPDQITAEDYLKFSKSLYDSEKCQVCILALETKR